MKKNKFKKLLSNLPTSLTDVNDLLENECFIMVDFMDGERVGSIEFVEDGGEWSRHFDMLGVDGCSLDVVDLEHILGNSITK